MNLFMRLRKHLIFLEKLFREASTSQIGDSFFIKLIGVLMHYVFTLFIVVLYTMRIVLDWDSPPMYLELLEMNYIGPLLFIIFLVFRIAYLQTIRQWWLLPYDLTNLVVMVEFQRYNHQNGLTGEVLGAYWFHYILIIYYFIVTVVLYIDTIHSFKYYNEIKDLQNNNTE